MEDEIAGVQVCGSDVFQQQGVMAVERDQRIATLLGFGRKSRAERLLNCVTSILSSPARKSVIVCCTDGPAEVGANTNWSWEAPPVSTS